MGQPGDLTVVHSSAVLQGDQLTVFFPQLFQKPGQQDVSVKDLGREGDRVSRIVIQEEQVLGGFFVVAQIFPKNIARDAENPGFHFCAVGAVMLFFDPGTFENHAGQILRDLTFAGSVKKVIKDARQQGIVNLILVEGFVTCLA
jgi:hypothetical protein